MTDEIMDRKGVEVPWGAKKFNRQGVEISLREWCELFEKDPNYKVVEQTELPNGYFVSTVWLGLNHSWDRDEQLPIIFETMVFAFQDGKYGRDFDQVRYSTEAEAEVGHRELVAKWALEPPPVKEIE